MTWLPWLQRSTAGLGRHWDGGRLLRLSTQRCGQFRVVLRRPVETKQYTSLAFGQRCAELGGRPSTGSVGDAFDNATAEAFFATLECELLDRQRFNSQAKARMAVLNFIEGFYNPSRQHSGIRYFSLVTSEGSTWQTPNNQDPSTDQQSWGTPNGHRGQSERSRRRVPTTDTRQPGFPWRFVCGECVSPPVPPLQSISG